jgi:hypothetical protein
LLTESSLKSCEGRLSSSKIAALQSLTDGLEILGATGLLKWLPILIGAALAECGQGAEILLRCVQVAGLQVLSELGEIGVPRL